MSAAMKHMERSHRSAAKRNTGVFNKFNRNAYAASVAKQQRKKTFGKHFKGALKHAAGKES